MGLADEREVEEGEEEEEESLFGLGKDEDLRGGYKGKFSSSSDVDTPSLKLGKHTNTNKNMKDELTKNCGHT